MATTFANMKTNVGNNVQDTSGGLATIIGTYLNKRMYMILRSINWNIINEDYTISAVAGTQDYTLATDFGKELYCEDATNKRNIVRVSLKGVSEQYPGKTTTLGNIERYSIFDSDDASKYIRFHYVPATNATINLPYMIRPTALSGVGDVPVIEISDLIEVGATADTWRYKRQFAKARDVDAEYRIMLADYIWDEYNQPNMVYQFKPNTFNRDDLV